MSIILGTLLEAFAETDQEVLSHLIKIQANSVQACAAEKALRRFERRSRTELQTINLDNVTTLDAHIRLLDLQNECMKRESGGNAEKRLVFAKLDILATLEIEIITNHKSELEKLPAELRGWFAQRREIIEETRVGYSEVYRTIVFQNM
ncbi:hypothetical protein KCU81_g6794, partial [Aureobasidium melanogenum]|uniref:Uncharacterized protein n=1 Tax=Aureobasidium melanogenum (strain CBS 110374) TaxID=1043003 RepID=A0A074VNY5_AURM1